MIDHWVEALGPCTGQQASVGFDMAQTPRWSDSSEQWPASYVERLVIRLESLNTEAYQALARARNLHAQQIALWIEHPDDKDLNQLLGLGFKQLAGPKDVACYGYDLASYNHTRDWNNPRYWANPERWGKDYW